jgi:hypothetical protein
MQRTSEVIRPHFWGFSPNGGFGIWWFFPPNPALAGNASRWTAAPLVQLIREQDPLKQGLRPMQAVKRLKF